jgi:hypothetical protein
MPTATGLPANPTTAAKAKPPHKNRCPTDPAKAYVAGLCPTEEVPSAASAKSYEVDKADTPPRGAGASHRVRARVVAANFANFRRMAGRSAEPLLFAMPFPLIRK